MRYAPAFIGLLASGCVSAYSPETLRTSPGQASAPTFATQLAGPATFLAPMPTAVIVLKPGDLNRNRAFCAAITRLPTAQQALATSAIAPNLILTRWLVQLPDIPAGRAADCDFLVGVYDYARAARLTASLRLSNGSLAGPGPFLLMAIPDNTGLHIAGLDGSAYVEADLPNFVATWASSLHQAERRLSQQPDQPGLVRSVFDLISAILRTATNLTGGLLRGVATSL